VPILAEKLIHAAYAAFGDQAADDLVGAENADTLCDLRIFVDQAAEPVPARNARTGRAIRSSALVTIARASIRASAISTTAASSAQVPEADGGQEPVLVPGRRRALPDRQPAHQRTRLWAALIPGNHAGLWADREGIHARLRGSRYAVNAARPWLSVEKPTVHTDRHNCAHRPS
jgi:hypothetical protein